MLTNNIESPQAPTRPIFGEYWTGSTDAAAYCIRPPFIELPRDDSHNIGPVWSYGINNEYYTPPEMRTSAEFKTLCHWEDETQQGSLVGSHSSWAQTPANAAQPQPMPRVSSKPFAGLGQDKRLRDNIQAFGDVPSNCIAASQTLVAPSTYGVGLPYTANSTTGYSGLSYLPEHGLDTRRLNAPSSFLPFSNRLQSKSDRTAQTPQLADHTLPRQVQAPASDPARVIRSSRAHPQNPAASDFQGFAGVARRVVTSTRPTVASVAHSSTGALAVAWYGMHRALTPAQGQVNSIPPTAGEPGVLYETGVGEAGDRQVKSAMYVRDETKYTNRASKNGELGECPFQLESIQIWSNY